MGRNSVAILEKMTSNNPHLDLVNVDVHTKYGKSLSIDSQDIGHKPNKDRITDRKNDGWTG